MRVTLKYRLIQSINHDLPFSSAPFSILFCHSPRLQPHKHSTIIKPLFKRATKSSALSFFIKNIVSMLPRYIQCIHCRAASVRNDTNNNKIAVFLPFYLLHRNDSQITRSVFFFGISKITGGMNETKVVTS